MAELESNNYEDLLYGGYIIWSSFPSKITIEKSETFDII